MRMLIQLIITGLALGGVYSLISMGYSLIYKASGLMTFAQGDILTVGAFLGLTFYRFLKLPYIVALLLTMAVAFIIGFLLEKGVIRKLLNKNVNAIYIVLATIAVSYIFQNGAQAIWSSKVEYFPSVFSTDSVAVLGVNVQPESLLCIGASMICMILLHFFMTKTRIGTSMRAAAMDSMAAESCGINVSLNTGITWGYRGGDRGHRRHLHRPHVRRLCDPGLKAGNQGFCRSSYGRLRKHVRRHGGRPSPGPSGNPGGRLHLFGASELVCVHHSDHLPLREAYGYLQRAGNSGCII